MSNTPLPTDKLSADEPSISEAFTRAGQYALQGFVDGLSGNGALLDWMSAEGLLEYATCEANCE